MKTFLKISIVFIFITAPFQTTTAQRNVLNDFSQVTQRAKYELDSIMQSGSKLQLQAAKNKIKGEFLVDITIHEKGKVLSVYMVSSDVEDIKFQNSAKDLIRAIKFGFKMPKKKTYKFQYNFIFK